MDSPLLIPLPESPTNAGPVGAAVASFVEMMDIDLFAAVPQQEIEDNISSEEHLNIGTMEAKDFFAGKSFSRCSNGRLISCGGNVLNLRRKKDDREDEDIHNDQVEDESKLDEADEEHGNKRLMTGYKALAYKKDGKLTFERAPTRAEPLPKPSKSTKRKKGRKRKESGKWDAIDPFVDDDS